MGRSVCWELYGGNTHRNQPLDRQRQLTVVQLRVNWLSFLQRKCVRRNLLLHVAVQTCPELHIPIETKVVSPY